MILFNVISILLTILFLALFMFGLIQCRKHSFTAGFYFFLILIVSHISPLIFSPIMGKYIDSLAERNASSPMGMTIGELVTWINLIPRIIEVIAFCILVVGLYRMWKSKTIKS